MSSLPIAILLLVSVCCHESILKTASALEGSEVKPSKLDELRKLADVTTSDSTRRKSKILGSLAFLAGLSVGGLAGAASTTGKTSTRNPQGSLGLNLGGTRLTPYFAAFYDPHAYAAHSLLYNPFYSLVDPARLQAAVATALASAAQNSGGQNQAQQVLNIFGNKEELDSGEEYVDAGKRQDVKTAEHSVENNQNNLELSGESSMEDQMVTRPVTCSPPSKKLSNGSKGGVALREGTLGSNVHHHNRVASLPQTANATNPGTATTTNGTNSSDPTVHHGPGFGYYGGDPHLVAQVDFTTSSSVGYDYPVNYNLQPPYTRPANFYPEESYAYYGHPDGYQGNQYLQDQPAEYVNQDYNRLLYAPDNPPYANGFRPL